MSFSSHGASCVYSSIPAIITIIFRVADVECTRHTYLKPHVDIGYICICYLFHPSPVYYIYVLSYGNRPHDNSSISIFFLILYKRHQNIRTTNDNAHNFYSFFIDIFWHLQSPLLILILFSWFFSTICSSWQLHKNGQSIQLLR